MLQHAGRTYLMVVIRLPCTGSQHTVDAVVKAFQCWGCFRVYMGGGGVLHRAPVGVLSSAAGWALAACGPYAMCVYSVGSLCASQMRTPFAC